MNGSQRIGTHMLCNLGIMGPDDIPDLIDHIGVPSHCQNQAGLVTHRIDHVCVAGQHSLVHFQKLLGALTVQNEELKPANRQTLGFAETVLKIRKDSSLMRSATAPETIVAAVAANIAWKMKSVK